MVGTRVLVRVAGGRERVGVVKGFRHDGHVWVDVPGPHGLELHKFEPGTLRVLQQLSLFED